MTHRIHDRLPSGFSYANELQDEEFQKTGSVNGASKVCLVRVDVPERYQNYLADLAIRLRPPRSIEDVVSRLGREAALKQCDEDGESLRWYIAEYNRGWAAGARGPIDRSEQSHAWDDGYLDRAAGRAKWHLTYCSNHDDCGEG